MSCNNNNTTIPDPYYGKLRLYGKFSPFHNGHNIGKQKWKGSKIVNYGPFYEPVLYTKEEERALGKAAKSTKKFVMKSCGVIFSNDNNDVVSSTYYVGQKRPEESVSEACVKRLDGYGQWLLDHEANGGKDTYDGPFFMYLMSQIRHKPTDLYSVKNNSICIVREENYCEYNELDSVYCIILGSSYNGPKDRAWTWDIRDGYSFDAGIIELNTLPDKVSWNKCIKLKWLDFDIIKSGMDTKNSKELEWLYNETQAFNHQKNIGENNKYKIKELQNLDNYLKFIGWEIKKCLKRRITLKIYDGKERILWNYLEVFNEKAIGCGIKVSHKKNSPKYEYDFSNGFNLAKLFGKDSICLKHGNFYYISRFNKLYYSRTNEYLYWGFVVESIRVSSREGKKWSGVGVVSNIG